MIELVYDLLNDSELTYLDNILLNFKIEDTPRVTNYYNRMFLNKETQLIEYQEKILKYLKEKFTVQYEIEGMWINQVTTDTNKDDAFHLDENALTIVTYINDSFEGGEFEYFLLGTKPNPKIKPKRNLSLITTNELAHKVNPVTNGIRYSLIVFCTIPLKDKKTML